MTDIKAKTKNKKNPLHIKELLRDVAEEIEISCEQANDSSESVYGVKTGFKQLDLRIGALNNSELIIIAGRPSMGKTSFALSLAMYSALKINKHVAIFSMEMTAKQVINRLLSSMSKIESSKLKSGNLEDREWPQLARSQSMLAESNLYIDDEATRTPKGIRKACLKLKQNNGLDLVIIDYLQLIQVYGHKDRVDEITKISRSLKVLSRELNVPIIVTSQLNRALEQRPNKRPVFSDIRDSGAIEEDADLILFVYRDEIYNEESLHKGKAEIIIAKNRNGPKEWLPLDFIPEFARFENYSNKL
jgi:replicative DNA helicase